MAKSIHISDEAKRIHSESTIIDIHCHPSLKIGLYDYKIYEDEHRLNEIIGGSVPNTGHDEMFQMQYDLNNMSKGGISAIWSSVYIIEKGLIENSSLKILKSITDFFRIKNINNSVERCSYPSTSAKCYGPYTQALEMMDRVEEQIAHAASMGTSISVARSYSDLVNAMDNGEMCFIHTMEGAHMLGRNLSVQEYFTHLDTLKHLGVCSITLGHFMPNNVCFPANGISPKTRKSLNFKYDYSEFVADGLLETGKQIVNHMLDIGIIVDLNHVNAKGRSDVYAINEARGSSARPLVFTHTGVRAFCKREMISPDDFEIKEIQKCGGVIGIILMKYWLCGSESTPDFGIEHIINTIRHIANVCGGSYDNISIGTDMDGFTQPVDDLYEPSQMVRLTQAMLSDGIAEENIKKILGGNALRVMAEGWGDQKNLKSKAMDSENRLLDYFKSEPETASVPIITKSLKKKLPVKSAPKSKTAVSAKKTGKTKLPVKSAPKSKTAVSAKKTTKTDLPPLDAKALAKLRKDFEANPEKVLKWFQRAIDTKITMQQLREAIYESEVRVKNKSHSARELETRMDFMKKSNPLPPGFTFEGMDLSAIPVDPGRTKFETNADILGWIFFSGPHYLMPSQKHPFHSHDNKAYSQGKNFIDTMEEATADKPVDVAVLADFGTGYYHSRYIAKQLKEAKYPYAVHLGDVYYSGTQKEFDENFIRELDPILNDTCLYTLNSNHEMFSGSAPYFKYIVKRLNNPKQKQRGSYFCLRNSKFNLIGIDTDYYEQSRYSNAKLRIWLENRLIEGRNAGQMNILFSANEPYEHNSSDLTDLINLDLRKLLIDRKLVDLWFWGNVHYCALYDRTSKLPFIGSCVGHGGYPYYTQSKDEDYKCPVRVRFLETKSRFWKWPQMRQDVGNNGYCVMSLKHDGSVELKYLDWMKNVRCTARLYKDANDELHIMEIHEM
ncbi:MAG: membrane dipeptidase [Ignavibacteria bacterium]|nr:membrane dipeptidase [Ignavibacteria bacterium]